MIGMLLRTGFMVGVLAYATGVAHSSIRHYFHKYTQEEDRVTTGLVQEVRLLGEEKKVRGGKK